MNPRLPMSRRLWMLVAPVLLVLIVIGVVVLRLVRPDGGSAHPSQGTSTMFPASVTADVAHQVASVDPQAGSLMDNWWRQHGPTSDDAGFAQWINNAFPGPPAKTQRVREAQGLEPLAAARTSQGIVDAQWLDDHGHDDVWKSLAQSLPSRTQSELDDLLDFAAQVGSDLKNNFGAASPYVIDPTLRSDQSTTAKDGECVCSYPSSHAETSAAARAFLAHFQTDPSTLLRWEAEIDYSRLYVAGHVPSDIRAGAMLGDMIGEYFLVTRGHAPVPATP